MTQPKTNFSKNICIEHIATATSKENWPVITGRNRAILPEIAIVGRSNVGKSTLINLLAHRKKIARISSTPGKTRELQFFLVDEKCVLVDLPGYGFAKTSQKERLQWGITVDEYMNHRSTLKLLIILLDIRRTPSVEDEELILWAKKRSLSFLIIFTKTDLVSLDECERQAQKAYTALSIDASFEKIFVPCSRKVIWSKLEKML